MCPKWSILSNFVWNAYIVNHIWSFNLPHDIWPWVALKGQLKVIGLCIIDHAFLDSGALRPRGLLSLFWHEASSGWWQWTGKRRIWLNHSKGHYQGRKGPGSFSHNYFSILKKSSIEVLPKCIASCSFSEVILVLSSNFNCVDWF